MFFSLIILHPISILFLTYIRYSTYKKQSEKKSMSLSTELDRGERLIGYIFMPKYSARKLFW